MVKKRKKKKVRNSLTERKDNEEAAIRTFTIGKGRKRAFGKKSTGKQIFHQDEEDHLSAFRPYGMFLVLYFFQHLECKDYQHERTQTANTTETKTEKGQIKGQKSRMPKIAWKMHEKPK